MKALYSGMICLLLSLPASAGHITFIDAPPSGGTGTDYRILSVTGVNIEGVSYDVMFHHGVSFDALSEPRITFGTDELGLAAAVAISQSINDDGVDGGSMYTFGLLVPYSLSGGSVLFSGAVLDSIDPLVYSPGIAGYRATDFDLEETVAFATFAPSAVPEPSSLTLVAFGVALSSARARRRRLRSNRTAARSRLLKKQSSLRASRTNGT